ncbi:p-hydroxybenzoic acid--AMP ligase FadD22 [Micromonospora sp. MH33]|uniref:AMP-binding protein n=1 Tax=Micromonospora sp. MH33 TaxID=1945509 RepID=UPI000D14B832|nr:AMP-binding protein [Micromonospora sp. MH33]PSK65689.1 p-hydroxybenzoic acid--AMP ligase FadD22 [Micromonospora sp. MH33]
MPDIHDLYEVDAGRPAGADAPTPDRNVAARLAGLAREQLWWDRPAYLDDAGTWTHGELHDWAARAATVLIGRGVRPGDRVLLALPDRAEWVGCFLAVARLGAVVVPVNPALTVHEHSTLVADCRPVAVIADGPAADHFDPAALVGPAQLDRLARAATPAPAHPVDDRTPLYIQYTSGTTGQPKGAVHRHADFLHYHRAVGEAMLRLRPEDVSFSVSKLFFAYGLGNSLVYPLHSGSAAVLTAPRPGPARIAELVRRHRVTVLHAVPSAYANLVAEVTDPEPFRSVRVAVSAGEPLAPTLGEQATALLGAPVLDELGSTEIGGACCANRLDDNQPGTIGRPLPGYELRVCDDSGRPLDGPVEGELWVRGPTLLTGYLHRPEETARVLVDGWLRTGDRVTRLPDGRYRHGGRLDDLELVGGITMSPVEVERLLLTHPLVREAGVAAVPDDRGATKLRAYVVCAVDQATVPGLADELIGLVRSRLATYKVPRSVEFVAALPRTPTGKLRRFVLRRGLQRPA